MTTFTPSGAAGVAASTANKHAVAADLGEVQMRAATQVLAGSYTYDGPALATGWHSHDLHQLEYACSGAVGLETEHAKYLLPPHQAVWIPAGLRHISTLGDARTVSVFFAPSLLTQRAARARVVAVSPLVREMVLHAVRWPITRTSSDAVADAYFQSMALLLPEWLEHEAPFSLPVSSEPLVAAAMSYTQDNLATVTPARMAQALATSERTLRRQFLAATGMPWKDYLVLARVLRALALLADGSPTVLDVAGAVGFESSTAFTRAFVRGTGETPSAYRRRVRS